MQSIMLGQESVFLLRELSEKLCAGKALHKGFNYFTGFRRGYLVKDFNAITLALNNALVF